MKSVWLTGAGALALAGALPASAQRATSAYTPLDAERCQVIERIEEGASVRWRCPGRGGVALFLNTGDARYDLDAGIDNGRWESLTPLNTPGPNVEWRLRGGRPIAIIYRLAPADPAVDFAPALIVETIGARGRPGCEIARIDARRADANLVARAEADTRAAHFHCGRDRAATIGR